MLLLFFSLLFETRRRQTSRQETALGADVLLLGQGVTDFLTKIFGKLKVKFHVYMCAVPQTCKSDKKYCSQHEANSGFFHSNITIS